MSKKDKKVPSVAENSQAVISMLPTLEELLKTYIAISKGYQLYRENGGEIISGIEEHLGFEEQILEHSEKTKKTEKISENKEPEKDTKEKKAKKKDKHMK